MKLILVILLAPVILTLGAYYGMAGAVRLALGYDLFEF
jgi:hypothetical protein